MFLNKIKIRSKLILLLLLVGLVPVVTVSTSSILMARSTLTDAAYENLQALHEIKRRQIETYFQERQGDMGVLVEAVSAMRIGAFALENEESAYFSRYVEIYGYYDLFLIDPDGYVFYTVAQEADYQINLIVGPYADSNLGQLVREVLTTGQFGFADLEPYAPSDGAPSAFIAQPVFNKGEIEVIVALQLPPEGINAIMGAREGLGESGHTYLVGPDYRMRSDSFIDFGRSVDASFAGTIEANGADTESVQRALAGEAGQGVITDPTGTSVLSTYSPVKVFGVTWALMTEIHMPEVSEPGIRLTQAVLVVGCSAVTIAGLLAWFAAFFIANPIQKVVGIAQKIGAGETAPKFLDPEILAHEADNYDDEVGELARALQNIIREMQRPSQQTREPDRIQVEKAHRQAETADFDDFMQQLRGLIDEFLSQRKA